MAERTVAEKARIKPGTTIAVLNPVRGLVGTLGLPADVRFVPSKKAQLVFLFVSTRAELEARMPAVVAGLAPNAALWVFFRKGSTTAGLDMDRDSVWAAAAERARARLRERTRRGRGSWGLRRRSPFAAC